MIWVLVNAEMEEASTAEDRPLPRTHDDVFLALRSLCVRLGGKEQQLSAEAKICIEIKNQNESLS